MLFEKVGKTATASAWLPTLSLEGDVWFCFVVFMHTILKKNGVKAENSEVLFNSLVFESIAELAMHIESLEIEVEVPEKQREPVGEQQGSGLLSETGSKLGLKTNYYPTLLHALSLPGAQSTSVRQGDRSAGDYTGTMN